MLHNTSSLTTKGPFIEPDLTPERNTTPTPKAGQPQRNTSKKTASEVRTKVFVIDTSVLLHDHNALQNFEDNRVAIPITVLEELDTFKVGNDTKNFEARECIRIIDRLSKEYTLQDWIPLENESNGLLRIIMSDDRHASGLDASSVFDKKTNDHKILTAALQLQHDHGNRLRSGR